MKKESFVKQRALVVFVDFYKGIVRGEFNEFKELAKSSGLDIVATSISINRPNSRYFIGKGKVSEISEQVRDNNIDVVIFSHSLTPAQERNLEREINIQVIDRIGLILDIFAQRAYSHEGKLQVELAQLKYLSTRLIRGWAHLERQKGGIGLRGPGETQLETDRRLIGVRIKFIKERLKKIRNQRSQSRNKRKKNDVPIISLVGYTNAGKSTLFKKLTGSDAYIADKLFATLDLTLRSIKSRSGKTMILTDTVGFISDLPHSLIESFKATLDEVKESDLLIHVIDVDKEGRKSRIDEVNSVIDAIGASDVMQIEVYNKIDRHSEISPRDEKSENSQYSRVWLSSLTGVGVDLLLKNIEEKLFEDLTLHSLNLPITAGQLRAKLYELGVVKDDNLNEDGGWNMKLEMPSSIFYKICEDNKLDFDKL